MMAPGCSEAALLLVGYQKQTIKQTSDTGEFVKHRWKHEEEWHFVYSNRHNYTTITERGDIQTTNRMHRDWKISRGKQKLLNTFLKLFLAQKASTLFCTFKGWSLNSQQVGTLQYVQIRPLFIQTFPVLSLPYCFYNSPWGGLGSGLFWLVGWVFCFTLQRCW